MRILLSSLELHRKQSSQSILLSAGLLGMLALSLTGTAYAQTIVTATGNGTIQPAGPRTGTNGINFFNVEGSNNGTNASFGVLDFAVAPTSGTSVSGVSLSLVQSNAAFTVAGPVNVYIVTDTTTSILAGSGTPLHFDTASNPEGLGSQLGTSYLVGSYNFPTTGNVNSGTVDTIALNFTNSNASALFLNELAGGKIRLAVTAESATVAATWGGYNNTNAALRPTLTYTVTSASAAAPEGSSLALLVSSLLPIAGVMTARRRRK